MVISNNIAFVFTEVIKQIEPKSVLDIGMFYKNIGAVSRRILDAELDKNCRLTGVCEETIENLPIYETIYDEIITDDSYDLEKHFDLAVLLADPDAVESRGNQVRKAASVADCVLAYLSDGSYIIGAKNILKINAGDAHCILAVY